MMMTMNSDGVRGARRSITSIAFAGVIAWWAIPASAQQTAGTEEFAAPVFKVGQTWSYRTTAHSRDQQLHRPKFEWSRRVDSVGEDYVITTTGSDTDDAATTSGRFTKLLTLNQKVGDQTNVYEPFAFPLKAGKKWDTKNLRVRSDGTTLETTLSCEAGAIEKVKVPAGEFDAIPIICKGKWRNLNTVDQAKNVSWYAPALGANVKFEVETWARGREFAKWTEELTAYQPGS
jgi:hypothetical protein